MNIEGSYTFDASRDGVWEAMFDPEVLRQALPGCEEFEQIDDNEYKATLNIRIGPVQGRFKGSISLSNLNPPQSYHMEVSGQGAPGFVNGKGQVTLEEQDGSTIMHYAGDAQVGGRIASVGQRLLDSTAKSLTRQGLESVDAQIQARRRPPEATEAEVKPEPAPPSQTKVAVTVAKDVAEDFVPPARRPVLIGALVVLVILYLLSRRGNAEH